MKKLNIRPGQRVSSETQTDMSGQPLHPGNRHAGGGGRVRCRVSLPSSLVWRYSSDASDETCLRALSSRESKARKQANPEQSADRQRRRLYDTSSSAVALVSPCHCIACAMMRDAMEKRRARDK